MGQYSIFFLRFVSSFEFLWFLVSVFRKKKDVELNYFFKKKSIHLP